MTTPTTAKPTTSAFGRIMESPRAQRRALVVGLAIFAVGAVVFAIAFFRNTGHPLPDQASNQPATLVKSEPTVALDPAITPLLKKFIATAVERKNLGEAYVLVGPDLRGNLTKKQFERGAIPIVPYPVSDVSNLDFTVDYSHPTQAGVEVGLVPSPGHPGTRNLTFYAGLKKIGTGPNAHWVVNYWAPRYHPPVPKAQ
jgi:hypothetical protein